MFVSQAVPKKMESAKKGIYQIRRKDKSKEKTRNNVLKENSGEKGVKSV